MLLENNYVALFADSKNSLELEQRLIQTLVSRKVDGLIVNTNSYYNPSLIQLACQGMPVVLCDRQVSDYNFPLVGSEQRQPILDVVAHLKEEGFHTAAFFTEEYAANSARFTRRNAFLEAMAFHYPDQDAQSLSFTVDISDQAGNHPRHRTAPGPLRQRQYPRYHRGEQRHHHARGGGHPGHGPGDSPAGGHLRAQRLGLGRADQLACHRPSWYYHLYGAVL